MSLDVTKFRAWVQDSGGVLLEPTNEYELVRYRMPDRRSPGIVYTKKNRRDLSFVGGSGADVAAFQKGQRPDRIRASLTHKKARLRKRIFERDGQACCFCGQHFGSDVSFEHWLSASTGGTNNIENLALAHPDCNELAANRAVMEKVRLREAMHAIVATVPPWEFLTAAEINERIQGESG